MNRSFVLPLTAIVLFSAVVSSAAKASTPGILDKPSKVNPYNGMQQPDKECEFTVKPEVKKAGDKWEISFETTAACDATVSIIDGSGKVIRHLASGVLGKNAPAPFQQDSLKQTLVWDGLKDDFSKADPSGCTVRVSLGLKPELEKSLLWDPNELLGFYPKPTKEYVAGSYLTAKDKDGNTYVIDAASTKTLNPNGRVFDKDGKYVRTFFPPAAADVESIMTAQGYKTATTTWGDKVLIGKTYGFLTGTNKGRKSAFIDKAADAVAALKKIEGIGEITEAPRPEEIPKGSLPQYSYRGKGSIIRSILSNKYSRLAVDRSGSDLYFGFVKVAGIFRLNGDTGELDPSWFSKGELWNISDCSVGPDGHFYGRTGLMGRGQWIVRLDREGKPVDFGQDGSNLPNYNYPDNKEWFGSLAGTKFGGSSAIPPGLMKKYDPIKVLWTGEVAHNNTHTRGIYVASNGMIVTPLLFQSLKKIGGYSPFHIKHGIPNSDAPWQKKTFVALMDIHGKYYTANAVGDTYNGHNAFMDRDGNIYTGVGGLINVKNPPFGIKEGARATDWGGVASLVKFKWNGKIPATTLEYAKSSKKGPGPREGTLWTIPGVMPGWATGCTCFNNRSDMDYWSRTWITANYLGSILVVDANGNLIARVGRYGNVDDADEKYGKIHFGWVRCVSVSDKAIYAIDTANRRILKATLKYAAEETVTLP